MPKPLKTFKAAVNFFLFNAKEFSPEKALNSLLAIFYRFLIKLFVE
jgi:hypothetical protein